MSQALHPLAQLALSPGDTQAVIPVQPAAAVSQVGGVERGCKTGEL